MGESLHVGSEENPARKSLKVAKSGLRPYFPLITGIFVFRSGLGFSFQALEVPEPKVRKRPFSLTKTSGQPIKYASRNYLV